ncbi:hypothetical protein, partial [Streptomyces sp. MS191]|uniref:hypothetical protein n=1 Tax=Streptomyces sp. ms191 TaxID=1827978 RepID=UPI001C9C8735
QLSALDQGGDLPEPGVVGFDEHEDGADSARLGLGGREGGVRRDDRDEDAARPERAQRPCPVGAAED